MLNYRNYLIASTQPTASDCTEGENQSHLKELPLPSASDPPQPPDEKEKKVNGKKARGATRSSGS